MVDQTFSYIDLHCDTLLHGYSRRRNEIYACEDTMLDVKRLRKAGAKAQFFAIFFPPKEPPKHLPHDREASGGTNSSPEKKAGKPHFRPPVIADDLEFFKQAREILISTIAQHPDELAFAGDLSEMEKNFAEGKLSAFLTLEDGRAVEGSLERLRWFYGQGVRLITLTWNFPNCFGNPNSGDEEKMKLGLTQFGQEAVREMNRLGMLVDVSHLSDGGFWDVARISKKPFVASHSNCRALTDHPRNLTDEMIRALAEHGGVAGLNFAPEFVAGDGQGRISSVERLCLHAQHLLKTGGEDVVAIGTDFDGIEGTLEIGEPTQMYRLFEKLKMYGFTERQIEKAAYRNVERVIRDTL